MKHTLLAAGFVAAMGLMQSVSPVQAQNAEEIRRICYNKHAIPFTQRANASEERRRDSEAKRLACIRNGGKS